MSDELDAPTQAGPTSPQDPAQAAAQAILDQALASAAKSGEERLIDAAEEWVKTKSHPEEAGPLLELIDYARQMLGATGDAEGVDKSEWLYAWQMLQNGVWNLIGMALPNGQALPMVTMNARVANEMENIARAHGEAANCPVRLISFVPGAILQLIR